MLFVGIDNGLNGGIVGINEQQEVYMKFITPTIKINGKTKFDINQIVKTLVIQIRLGINMKVVLEQAHVRPISGIRASFTTGYSLGMYQGILSSLNLSYEIVSPQKWQKDILGKTGGDSKGMSINFCKQKWPSIEWKATKRCTKFHDGMCDAACMALYGLKQFNGGTIKNENNNIS